MNLAHVALVGSVLSGIKLYGPKNTPEDMEDFMQRKNCFPYELVSIEVFVGKFNTEYSQHYTIVTGDPFNRIGFTEVFENFNDSLIYAEEHYKRERFIIVKIDSDFPEIP